MTSNSRLEECISLRPCLGADEAFLFRVYASTRADEMKLVDWDVAQKESFLRMQFNAQHQYYIDQYPNANFQVILRDGQPVGRLYINRREDEIRIIDIALLPNFRGQGIGSFLMESILSEAAQHNKTVTLHVEQYNPAMQFYERLGFRLVEDKGVYCFMKWTPEKKEVHQDD
jgi:ribosomal protein S18 acetylase RimI-like enzyme